MRALRNRWLALAALCVPFIALQALAQSESKKPVRSVGETIGTKSAPAATTQDGTTGAPPTSPEQIELVKKLKDILAKLETNDPKDMPAPAEASDFGEALTKFATDQAAKSTDVAAINAYAEIVGRVVKGTKDQQRAFIDFPSQGNSAAEQIAGNIAKIQSNIGSGDAFDVAITYLFEIAQSSILMSDAASGRKIGEIWDKTTTLFDNRLDDHTKKLAEELTKKINENTNALIKSAQNDKDVMTSLTDLNSALQKIVGQSDYRLHVVAAAYGDRAELDHFVSEGRIHKAGRADRWCNATAAMRTKCERKAKCDNLEDMRLVMCGYDPAEFVSPRYKGVLVQYQCIRDSNAGFWLTPPLNASASDPVRFTRDAGPNYVVFITAPDQQLACEVK